MLDPTPAVPTSTLARRRFVALFSGAAAVALAACSPPAPAPTAAPKAGTTQPAAPAAGTSQPATSAPAAKTDAPLAESFTFVTSALPDMLDPQGTLSNSGFQMARMFFEALVILDDKAGVNPMLAESWKAVSPTTWQFTLRPNVKFHNGDPFTADAVVSSVNRIVQSKNPSHANTKGRLGTLAGAEKIDERTVNIITAQPDPVFLRRIAMLFFGHPSQRAEDDKSILEQPIGTGPYKVNQFGKAQYILADAVADHWRAKPMLKQVRYQQVAEGATQLAGLQSGDIDLVFDIQADNIELMKRNNLKVVTKVAGTSNYFDVSPVADTPMKDKRVRQAMNYAVDKESILSKLFAGVGELSKGQLTGADAFGHNPSLQPYPYDPNRAKALMQEAGVTGFRVKAGGSAVGKLWLEAAQSYWKPLGIEIDIEILDFAAYVPLHTGAQPGRPPVWHSRADYYQFLDAEVTLRNWMSNSQQKRYANPSFDEKVAAAQKEMDDAKRAALLGEAAAIMREDPPVVFLHQHGFVWGATQKVDGIQPLYDTTVEFDKIRKLK